MQELKQLFDRKLQDNSVSAAALVTLSNDEIKILYAGNTHKDTFFQIGSITKVFTALLACKSITAGRCSLNTSLSDILTSNPLSAAASTITLRELLTHTSGLPRLPDNFAVYMSDPADPYKHYGQDQLLDYLKTAEVTKDSSLSYSNLGYGLLGMVLAQVYGEPVDLLLKKIPTADFAMQQTFVYNGDDTTQPIFAEGHNKDGHPTPYWNMNVLSGAGGLVSTPADIAHFLKNILTSHPSTNWKHTSVQPLNNKMAWGWFQKPGFHNGHLTRRLWHNGITGGFASHVEVDLDTATAFGLLMNKSITPTLVADSLANAIFK